MSFIIAGFVLLAALFAGVLLDPRRDSGESFFDCR